jgi:hypothetical protein
MEINTTNKAESFDYGSLQLRDAEAAVLGAVLLKGGAFYGSN